MNYWDKNKSYGDLFYDRAIGKKEEMECSKAVCDILKPIYEPDMKILDVGCGAGHYLKSLIDRLDENVNYTGIDITEHYIEKAKKAFKDYRFFIDDIYSIGFKDESFDIVMCNNVIFHLPPFPVEAISELLRVSSNYVVIRVPIAKRNYIIKEVRDQNDDLDEEIKQITDEEGNPLVWNYLNLYTKEFFEDAISKINPDYVVNFIKDENWKNLESKAKSKTATDIMGGKQVSGNIVLDWYFIVVRK